MSHKNKGLFAKLFAACSRLRLGVLRVIFSVLQLHQHFSTGTKIVALAVLVTVVGIILIVWSGPLLPGSGI
jgi:hypothetical protein